MTVSRHFVIVASIGRAELLARTIARLASQTRRPEGIVVVSVTEADVTGLEAPPGIPLEILFSEKGLPIQRNVGLAHLADRADIITFFDDDFLPADNYLEIVGDIFAADPEIVGCTGRLIADGISSGGYDLDEALALVANDTPPATLEERWMPALYGCNMSFRQNATIGLAFDEALPLYGWQEDVDFSYQVGGRGKLLRTERLAGVHMGAKGGRTSGKRLGYSQIANPLYLMRKETIPRKLAWRLMRRNLAANLYGSLRPEPYVDRRGRLAGNLLAIRDLTLGRLHPTRILGLSVPAAMRDALGAAPAAGLVNGSVGFLSRAFSQLSLLGVTVLATRSLSTADFGAFAIASAFLTLTRNLLYVGPYEFLMKARPSDTVADSCLVANLAIGLLSTLIFGLLALGSQPLFGTAAIGWLLVTLLPSVLLVAVTSWFEALLLRRQRVRRYYACNVIGDFLGATTAITCLVAGFGLVALVAQVYVRLLVLLIAYLADRQGMKWPQLHRSEVGEVITWSRSRYGAALLNFLNGYGADLVLGVMLSPAATGIYRAANRIVFALSDLFVQPLLKIAQTNVSGRVARGLGPGSDWLRMFAGVAAFAWAALASLALAAHDIVPFVLGPQWDAAAPLVIIFCFARALSVLDSATTPVLVASDQQRFMLRIQVIVAIAVIATSTALANRGPSAVALATVAISLALTLLYARRALVIVGARLREVAGAIGVALVPALGVTLAALASSRFPFSIDGPGVAAAVRLGTMAAGGAIGLVFVGKSLLRALAALGAPVLNEGYEAHDLA